MQPEIAQQINWNVIIGWIAPVATAIWVFLQKDALPALIADRKEARHLKVQLEAERAKEAREAEHQLTELVKKDIEVMTLVQQTMPLIVEAINTMSHQRYSQIADMQEDITGLRMDLREVCTNMNIDQPSTKIRRKRRSKVEDSPPAQGTP
jgi:hypothetical protein